MIPRDRYIRWRAMLPQTWKMVPLKYVVAFNPEVLREDECPDLLIRYVDISGVDSNGYIGSPETLSFSDAPSRARRVTRPGDVIVSTVRTYLTAIARIKDEGFTVSTGFAVLRPRKSIDARFLAYWMRSSYIVHEIVARSTGVSYPSINPSELGQLPIPTICIREQQAIADFLERELARLDQLSREQARLASVLQEQRQAIITRLVTRGFSADSDLNDSGVEWLRLVPKHWEITRIGSVFKEVAEPGSDDLPILRVSIHDGVSDRQFEDEELERKVLRMEDTSKYKRVTPNDLVYNMMRAWQGAFGAVAVPGMVSPAYVVARPRLPLATKFVELLLRTPAAIEEMRTRSYGVADFRLRLYWENFKTMRIALPPFDEQVAIVEAAERETRSIDALAELIATQNTKLAEYRSALITAAVTGQIDVRSYRSQEAAVGATRKAPSAFVRTVLAAEIVHQLHSEPTFGHVKFQKILHLIQYHAAIENMDSNYRRHAAGPFDHQLLSSVESQMRRLKWYGCKKDENRYSYEPLAHAGDHAKYFDRYYADKRDEIQAVIDICRPMKTEQCEILSTLYGAWNDLLISGSPADDDSIVREVLTRWHSTKARISDERWHRALEWMKKHSLVPRGQGKPIKVRKAEAGA